MFDVLNVAHKYDDAKLSRKMLQFQVTKKVIVN